ncbi:hypothetical protein GGS23DRAFT_85800 [Durotheca rogersii]|uniref:uncharacterized protein n=1 Tax=Durotheca rogersii TaxID=419775 RepID=UPI00221EFD86|nr:uncharacterized protein GGS23DRAFT_85800 [Durotheca rogersii]KAI5862654.1 hypothetical protein GGS23DRAFT_85800 [Durotheca rogersii]
MSNYPYAPPPPPPAPSSAPPPSTYGRPHHGHHQGPSRGEYGSSYYQQQDYSSQRGAPYSAPQPAGYWQGAPPTGHGHPAGSSLQPGYHANYPPQPFHPQPGQPYQPPYPNQSSRPTYGPPFGQLPNEYPQPPQRMGYEQAYPAAHQPAPYQQPPYGYPPASAPSFAGAPQSQYGSSYKGHGRGGFPHASRGAHAPAGDRGDKFRHRDQKPHHQVFNNQKSDPAAAKKKKRKTNTLGLTPGDDDSDAGVDEEKRLEELLGADAPSVPDGDIAKWLAARKENFPTRARIAAKKEAGLIPKPEADTNTTKEAVTVQVDPVEKEADRLRKRLAKLDRKIEKRKRAPNDEGDDMRSESSDSSSDDDQPEALPTNKSSAGFLPSSNARADPSNHCKYYSTGGTCGKKGKCRFVHDPAVREAALQERTRNGGRMTLKQRLLLNDKDQDDMDLIKEIVNMRSNGRLHDPQNPHIHAERQAREQAAIAAVSTLPTAPGAASLPPNPYAHLKNGDGAARYRKPKRHNDWSSAVKYQGWPKLVGYGGAGVPPKQMSQS